MLRLVVLIASVGLLVLCAVCYFVRPDWGAAVTVWPAWSWPFGGVLVAALGASKRNRRGLALLGSAWLLFLFVFSDEPRSIARSLVPVDAGFEEARHRGEAVRVVSLNCAGGTEAAAEEVRRWKPDIVLYQESPSRGELERAAAKAFGSQGKVLWGMDGSIGTGGELTPLSLPRLASAQASMARVRLPSGFEAIVVSLRLIPAVFREDLWSPSCWRDHTENRRARREQLAEIVHALPPDGRLPIILGGDFNAPQGDAIFSLLTPRLHDGFGEGGRGWCDTIINEFPALRIDQVWLSKSLHAVSVRSHRTENSDHRAVVSDIAASSTARIR